MPYSKSYLSQLRENLDKYFSLAEIQVLCQDLGIDWDNLEGESKQNKALSLVRHLSNRDQIQALAALGSRVRPKASWFEADSEFAQVSQKVGSRTNSPSARLFISYCHEDMDDDVLAFLEQTIAELSDGKYEILIDKNLSIGEDLNEFMQLINDVDAVLLLLSPAYKRRVLARVGGVYQEYKYIMKRLDQIREATNTGKKAREIEGYFDLFPILLSGDHETAILDEINSLKYADFRNLRVLRGKTEEFHVSDQIRIRYTAQLAKIIDRLHAIVTLKSDDFQQLYADFYDKLFLDLKADWKNAGLSLKTLLVKTHVYRKVELQSAYFIIGRKGSGKSTVTDALSIRLSRKYSDHIAVIADNCELEFAWSMFHSDKQMNSDITNLVRRLVALQLVWELVLHLRCMEVIVKLHKRNLLNEYQMRIATQLVTQFELVIPGYEQLDESTKERAYFAFAFNSVAEFLKDCIQKSRNDQRYFLSDIKSKFNRLGLLNWVFGNTCMNALEQIIETSRKKFLVTLDDFDTHFDTFRRNNLSSGDLHQRSAFEIDWLRSLLMLILDIKQGRLNVKLYELIDFCITVPRDRFLEVIASERDSYRYIGRYTSLDWSGIELAHLLLKRLEELSQTSTRGAMPSISSRLTYILRQRYNHIPETITFEYNGTEYTMDLFLYVLRHTFWRPRDVLLYYAGIIATCEDLRRKKMKVQHEILRRIIRQTTFEVINNEFISEFSSVLLNINEIINLFHRSTQFLTYKELGQRLSEMPFKFASTRLKVKDTTEKIEFLFQIGFLGISASAELNDRLNIKHKHAFCFNEGENLLSTAGRSRYSEFEFIIHPVFFEYLQLDTGKREFVLDCSWEYLQEMEALMRR